MTVTQEHLGDLTPADVELQASAIAVLIERIARLSEEEKDDLMSVVMEIRDCDPSELEEIQQTMREILFPAMAGRLLERGEAKDASQQAKKALSRRREEISSRLRKLRDERCLTQEELAEKAGLPQSHISRLRAGRHAPSLKTITKLADALGVSITDIDPAQD